MDKTFIPILVAGLLAVAGVSQGHLNMDPYNGPTEPVLPGTSFPVNVEVYYVCSEIPAWAAGPFGSPDPRTSQDYEIQILEAADGSLPWVTSTSETVTIALSDCPDLENAGSPDVGVLGYSGNKEVELTVDVALNAPAGTFSLTPGEPGNPDNEDVPFEIEIAYNPAFSAPTAQSYDHVGGTTTATIPLTVSANGNSVFDFAVMDVPEGFTAHIQDSLEVDAPYLTGEESVTNNVELHFSVDDAGDHDGHDEEAMDEGMADDEDTSGALALFAMGRQADEGNGTDEMEMEEGHGEEMDHSDHGNEESSGDHAHWETAEVHLAITLANADDLNQTSEPQMVVLTFTNKDTTSMPHDDGHDHSDDDGFLESVGLPGFELVAALATIGAIAALRRQ